MLESLPDLVELLEGAPTGEYVVTQIGLLRILWRLSDGGPADDALDPADLIPAPVAA
jgi:hypothetical protein